LLIPTDIRAETILIPNHPIGRSASIVSGANGRTYLADKANYRSFLSRTRAPTQDSEPGTVLANAAPTEPESELKHDSGKSGGMRSIAGNGHGVRFESPDDDQVLTSVEIFGSRYGYPKPPDEDFHVWLCDDEMHELAKFDFPYSTFERGEPRWVKLPIDPTKVPRKFVVCVGFNPEQTKGVYVHHDDQPGKHSLVGLPGQKATDFAKGNWMIRARIRPSEPARPE
jgi:RNA polymerase sigma-70 factor (ECF subfamily)